MTKIPDEILEISKNLHTQDNLATSQPIFMVQRKFRQLVPEGHSDDYCWISADEGDIADDDTAAALDAYEDENDEALLEVNWSDEPLDFDDYTKEYFIWRWENVQPFFTRAGAEDYQRINGHNLGGDGSHRIYVESGWRNTEWQIVREYLMGIDIRPNAKVTGDPLKGSNL